MRNSLALFALTMIGLVSFAQNQAYQIYTSKGKKVSEAAFLKAVSKKKHVFFGEYHDNPISHWLQLELTKKAYEEAGQNLVLSFEMFERDNQRAVDLYVDSLYTPKQFEDSCRLWPNYKTDYKPLLDFARENHLRAIAANVPRRYANKVFKYGREALDSLTETELSWCAEKDFAVDTTLSQYAALLEMGQHMGGSGLMLAQAFKDATMAKFILYNLAKDAHFIHFNGAYHSDYYQSTVWYFMQGCPWADVCTISTVSQSNVRKLDPENKDRADFIICVDDDMTSTH